MIYMRSKDCTLIIVEDGNLEYLKKGLPLATPDRKVVVAWTPDIGWLASQLVKCDELDFEQVSEKIAASIQRANRENN